MPENLQNMDDMTAKHMVAGMGLSEEEIEKLESTDNAGNEKIVENEMTTIDTSKFTKTQLEAYNKGWVPQDFFEGDPENWLPAGQFLNRMELIEQNRKLREESKKRDDEFEKRLAGTQAILKAQAEEEIKNLETARLEAMSIADVEKALEIEKKKDKFEKAINATEYKSEPQSQPQHKIEPEVEEWLKHNTWMSDAEDIRVPVANHAYDTYKAKNPNCKEADALAYVDKKLAELKPANQNINPRRSLAAGSDYTGRQSMKKSGEITMDTLSEYEKKQWNNPTLRSTLFNDDQKIFLECVTRARKFNQQRRDNNEY